MGKKWDYDVPSVDVWNECLRVLKPGGYLLSFAGSRTYHRMTVAVEDAGFEIRDQIMWVYGSGFPKSLNVGKKVEAFEGWGTALKPAHEPIVMARKPFKGTVANNVLEYGTGAINIDGCRVATSDHVSNHSKKCDSDIYGDYGNIETHQTEGQKLGRFPANFIHDGLEEEWGRYFYCPKASKKDRNAGCTQPSSNNHPTVKPHDLMRYLCRLVTQPGGVVLDPFMGSGSTGRAALVEGFDFIGIEREPEYFAIAEARCG
jgi:site-specific DNA-methyltransferase (adenine-specific)